MRQINMKEEGCIETNSGNIYITKYACHYTKWIRDDCQPRFKNYTQAPLCTTTYKNLEKFQKEKKEKTLTHKN